MSGYDIKMKILASGLKIWQVAKAYGVTDSTFSRKLRNDFNKADAENILSIIEKLKKA